MALVDRPSPFVRAVRMIVVAGLTTGIFVFGFAVVVLVLTE